MDIEEFESLASSSTCFDEVHSNVCVMEDISFSPLPNAEITPIIYVRKPSLSAQTSSENLCDPNMYLCKKDDKLITSIGRRFSHLLPLSYRSYDNLTHFNRKEPEELSESDYIHYNTKSLPPSPRRTPSATPQSSPKLQRNQIFNEEKKVKEGNLNSLPWYYTGIFATTAENKEVEAYSCEKQNQNQLTNSETKLSNHPTKFTPCYFHRDNPDPQKKFLFSNRDMNFFAPTSM